MLIATSKLNTYELKYVILKQFKDVRLNKTFIVLKILEQKRSVCFFLLKLLNLLYYVSFK